jgi:hypothetical protein
MTRVNHQDVVRKLLDKKAIDFAAIGNAVAEFGPAIAVADEPWEGFCGTMRYFIHVYRITNPGNPVENLAGLANATQEIGR